MVKYRGITGKPHHDADGHYMIADLPNGVIISGPGEKDWVESEFKGMVDDYLAGLPGYQPEEGK